MQCCWQLPGGCVQARRRPCSRPNPLPQELKAAKRSGDKSKADKVDKNAKAKQVSSADSVAKQAAAYDE